MMRNTLLACLATLCLGGCSIFMERAPDYAVRALDSAADRTTSVVLDTAEEKARNPGSGDDEEKPTRDPGEQVTRKLDDDDVLILKDGNYLVGKQLGAQILIIRTGEKVDAAGQKVVPVRRAKKSDLKVGRDVYFTTARGDVRRASWTAGAVTDDGALGEGRVGVGPESELDWQGQVAVGR